MATRLGRYLLLDKIGQGGMAEVFAARLEGPQMFARNCVIKRLRKELAKQPHQVKLFMEEARLSAMLQHPCLVQVFDVGEDENGEVFFAMERVDGPSLAKLEEVLRATGDALPVDVAAYIGARAAEGLHFAHELVDRSTGRPLHIAHRDVSPHNILLGMAGDVKVADFGIAKADVEHRPQTQFGITKGKLAYMSPEQARGEKVDRRTDVYALGIVLWEMFAGRPLVEERAQRRRLEAGQIERPSTLRQGIDVKLDDIVLWALEPKAKDRTPTCRAVEDALDKWLLEHGPGARAQLQRLLKDNEPLLRAADEITNTQPMTLAPGASAPSPWPPSSQARVSANAATVVRAVGSADPTRIAVPGGAKAPFDEVTHPSIAAGELAMPLNTLPDALAFSAHELDAKQSTASTASASTNAASVQAGRAAVPLPAEGGNVPRTSTSFVGRSGELARIAALFDEGSRVVTLVGPGGTGKTRIAQHFAELQSQLRAVPGGVWFADLTDAKDAGAALHAIARSLGVPLRSGRTPAEAQVMLGHALSALGRSLVVLDSCDEIARAHADVVADLSRRCPRTRFLATSQQLLGVPGEAVLDVPPLPVPKEGADDLSDEGAVELFLQRARAARNGHALSESARGVVVEIVRTLDGVPLAIELAAARAATETPSEILARLRAHAARGANGADGRTLKAAIGETYAQLADDEQRAFRQASVFRGGFELDAADAVFDLGSYDATAALALERLKGRSLVVARPSSNGPRYTMLEALRTFATERLEEALEKSAAEARHAGYYVALGKKLAVDAEKLDARAGDRLALEVENLTAVIERARNNARPSTAAVSLALEAALALEPVLAQRASASEQLQLLDRALALADGKGVSPRVLMRGHLARGDARRLLGAFDQARADLNAALDLAASEGDAAAQVKAQLGLGALALALGKLELADETLLRALALAEGAHDDVSAGRALALLGKVSRLRRRLVEAEERCRRAVDASTSAGDKRAAGRALVELASTLLSAQKLDEAAKAAQRAIDELSALFDRRSLVHAWGTLAVIEIDRARWDEAESAATRAVDAAVKVGERRAEGLYVGMRAAALHGRGALIDAREHYAHAARALLDVGDDGAGAFYLGLLGAVQAALDDIGGALQSFATADRRLASADRPLLVVAVGVLRALFELFRAGDSSTQRTSRDAVRAVIDSASIRGGAFEQSEEVRFAVRIARAALG